MLEISNLLGFARFKTKQRLCLTFVRRRYTSDRRNFYGDFCCTDELARTRGLHDLLCFTRFKTDKFAHLRFSRGWLDSANDQNFGHLGGCNQLLSAKAREFPRLTFGGGNNCSQILQCANRRRGVGSVDDAGMTCEIRAGCEPVLVPSSDRVSTIVDTRLLSLAAPPRRPLNF